MPDFLAEKRKEISDRLKELGPLVAEYQRLQEAAEALEGIPAASPNGTLAAAPRASARRPGRARDSKSAARAAPARKRRPGRRKGTGKRAGEAFTIIQEQPGITIPDLAARMGIKQNYLYKVLPPLEEAGSIVKQGRSWHPKEPVYAAA